MGVFGWVLPLKHAKIDRIILVWVSLDIICECLGRQVLLLNHAKIRRILLVWVLDESWECLVGQVFG